MIPEEVTSILLFKLRYIGDVLLTTPAIRLLRQAYPDARITMVVNKGTEEVLRYNPHLNRILTIDRERVKESAFYNRWQYEWYFLNRLRKDRYDLSVDFASGDRAAFLSLLSGVPYRIGFGSRKGYRRWIFNRVIHCPPALHTVERNLLLLQKALGLETVDHRLELYTGKADEHQVTRWIMRNHLQGRNPVVVHPGARYRFKRWPNANWTRLADILQGELGVPVVFAGGQKDLEDIRSIVSRMQTQVYSLAGKTTILEMAALFKRATLFIGNDSGPGHLAAAVGAPVISLFGPTDPNVWRPWGREHVVISKQVSCSPCADTDCDKGKENCMERISVEDVLHSVCQFLEKPVPPQSIAWSNIE
jgi:predicted lipopolysaccharide heptosyltransferase III